MLSYPRTKECMIRSVHGGDLIVVRHDPGKKFVLSFALEDPHGNNNIAWLAADLDDGAVKSNYTVHFPNKLNPQDPEEVSKIRIEGNLDGDHVDWKFKDTGNRIVMLRAESGHSGISLPDKASGTRVTAGFDLAMIAGMQTVADVHKTEFCLQEKKSEERNRKIAGELTGRWGRDL